MLGVAPPRRTAMRGPVAPPSDRSAAPAPLSNDVYVNGGEREGGAFQHEPAASGRSDAGGGGSNSSPSRRRVHAPAITPPSLAQAQGRGLAAVEGQQQRSAGVRGISSAAPAPAAALTTVAGHANNNSSTAVAAQQRGPSRLAVTSDSARSSRLGPIGAATLGGNKLVDVVGGGSSSVNGLQLQPSISRRSGSSNSNRASFATTDTSTASIISTTNNNNSSSSSNSSSGQQQLPQRAHPGIVPVEQRHHQQPRQLQQQQQQQLPQQPQLHQPHQRRIHNSLTRIISPESSTRRQQERQQERLIAKAGSGASWLVNSSGRPIAPVDGGSSVAVPGSSISSSPKTNINSTPRKRLPVPMAVASGTPTIYPACQECRELVKARLDEPVLLCEDRHRPGVFDTTTGEGGAEEGGGGSGRQQQQQQHQHEQQLARKRGSTWRLRDKTATFHLGLILCLNIGESRERYLGLRVFFKVLCIFGTRTYSCSPA